MTIGGRNQFTAPKSQLGEFALDVVAVLTIDFIGYQNDRFILSTQQARNIMISRQASGLSINQK